MDMLEDGDACSMLFVIGLLTWIGSRVVNRNPKLREWGVNLAGVVFLLTLFRGGMAFDGWLSIGLQAISAAGVTLGLSWILLPPLVDTFRVSVVKPIQTMQRGVANTSSKIANARRRAQEEREQRQQQEIWEQTRPQREEAARVEAEQARQRQQRQIEDRQRREDARVACTLLYHLRAPEISHRLPKGTFRRLLDSNLPSDGPVDLVERRARELQCLIEQHYQAVNPTDQFTDLRQLADWHEQQTHLINELPVADRFKRDFLVQLNERYADLTATLLERLQP